MSSLFSLLLLFLLPSLTVVLGPSFSCSCFWRHLQQQVAADHDPCPLVAAVERAEAYVLASLTKTHTGKVQEEEEREEHDISDSSMDVDSEASPPPAPFAHKGKSRLHR